MSKKILESRLKELEALQQEHLDKCMSMFKADNYALFPVDLLAISVFKRSMSLISGFCSLIRAKNSICAAPLLRLQIDNLLRFSAIFLVETPHNVAMEFINGKPISQFKDRKTGKNLTDSYLVKALSERDEVFKWIPEVYKNTSGYIHLSEKHWLNSIISNPDKGMVSVKIGIEDNNVGFDYRLEATDAMLETTKMVLWFLSGWVLTKENVGINKQSIERG